MLLVQRFDFSGRFHASRSRPGVVQFVLVLHGPLDDKTLSARWKATGQYRQGLDANNRLIPAVEGVKVRRRVIVEVHPNDDSVEAAELRH